MPSSPANRAALITASVLATAFGPMTQPAVAQEPVTGGGTPAPTMSDPVAPAPPSSAPPVSETRTVRLTRPQVKSVQRRAHVRADGTLGAQTRTALRRYQAKKQLRPTGRPNLQTLKAMRLAFARKIEQRLMAQQRTTAPASSTVAGYAFPIQGRWSFGGAATAFGDRGGSHQGLDMPSACGTPVTAASTGTVKVSTDQSAAGNYVVITGTPTGEDQAYMHLRSPSPLSVGDRVDMGTPVGSIGDTGNATACLLHFELWTAPGWYEGGKPRDPRSDLEAWSGNTAQR